MNVLVNVNVVGAERAERAVQPDVRHDLQGAAQTAARHALEDRLGEDRRLPTGSRTPRRHSRARCCARQVSRTHSALSLLRTALLTVTQHTRLLACSSDRQPIRVSTVFYLCYTFFQFVLFSSPIRVLWGMGYRHFHSSFQSPPQTLPFYSPFSLFAIQDCNSELSGLSLYSSREIWRLFYSCSLILIIIPMNLFHFPSYKLIAYIPALIISRFLAWQKIHYKRSKENLCTRIHRSFSSAQALSILL